MSQQQQADYRLQLQVLQRLDPCIIKILFVSTFTAVYEVVKGETQQRALDIEGSLYLLQSSQQPYFKIYLLNRVTRDDLVDWVTEQTDFAEKDQFVAYTTKNSEGKQVRRIFYFSIAEEKDQFMGQLKQCLHKVETTSERQQIKETLIKIVQDDKFLDYFIQLLKQRK